MKKTIVALIATVIWSNHVFAIETATNALAYTLAQSIYTAALGIATSEATSLAVSSKDQKVLAKRIENDAQAFRQSGSTTLLLESKIQMAKELDDSLSDEEAVDLVLQATQIILDK